MEETSSKWPPQIFWHSNETFSVHKRNEIKFVCPNYLVFKAWLVEGM